jgi:hypothetical protein
MSEEELRTKLSRLFVNWKESPFIDPIFHLAVEEYAKFREAAAVREVLEGLKPTLHLALTQNNGEVHEDFGPTWRTERINEVIDAKLAQLTHEQQGHEPAE